MPIQPPMKGFLERTNYATIPSIFKNTTSGLNGVVSNLYWGDLQLIQPATFTASIGSTQFNTDRNAIEITTSPGAGPYSTLIANINGIDNNLAPGAQTKLRFFQGVGAVNNFTNPPAPSWLYTLCGYITASDSFHGTPYWVSGTVRTSLSLGSQQSGDVVLSPANGLQYVAQQIITNAANTVDPSTVAPNANWAIFPSGGPNARGYGAGAGRFPNWYGANAANYLAAYSYWMLLMANCRLFVANPTWTHPGDGGTWFAGGLPQTIGGTTYTSGVNATGFTLDTCPMVGEVTMSACTTIYSEPCIRQISGSPAQQYKTPINTSFLAGGYTWYSGANGTGTFGSPQPDSDLGQLLNCQSAMVTAWPNTCISEANNPYQVQGGIPEQATSTTSFPTTQKLIANLVNTCEPGQGVPGNNSLQGTAGYDNGIAPYVAALGGPVYFQTNTLQTTNFAAYPQVFEQGEACAAYNIELPAGYGGGSQPWVTPSQLATAWATLQGYMSAGTGPPTGPAPAPNTTAYAATNIRNQSGGPVFTAQSATPTATVGSAYTYTFTASGSSNTFDIVSGFVPTGLTLSSSGVLSGTPTTASAFSFVVRVRNAGGTQTSSTQTITVAVVSGAPVFTNGQPPDMTLGVAYTFTLTATNTPTSWAPGGVAMLTGLPTGVSLNTSTGVISGTPYTGTPIVPGGVTFAFKAINGSGTTLSPVYSVNVLDPNLVIPTSAVWISSTQYGKVMA